MLFHWEELDNQFLIKRFFPTMVHEVMVQKFVFAH